MPKRPAPSSSEWTQRKKFRGRGQRQITQYTGWQPRAFQRGEWKFLDVAIGSAMNTSWGVDLLDGIAPGAGASQRIGMKIMIRSLEFRLRSYATPATGTDQLHRIVIFLDRQANAATPGATAALTAAAVLSSASELGMRNLAQRHRFKILYDKTKVLNATGEPFSDQFLKVYMKFRRPIVVEYNAGTAGTIADIASNALYVMYYGSNVAGATAGTISGILRIRYSDE